MISPPPPAHLIRSMFQINQPNTFDPSCNFNYTVEVASFCVYVISPNRTLQRPLKRFDRKTLSLNFVSS